MGSVAVEVGIVAAVVVAAAVDAGIGRLRNGETAKQRDRETERR